MVKSLFRRPHVAGLLALAVLLGTLSGCSSRQNTRFAPGFSDEAFQQIPIGITEEELVRRFGKPLRIHTKVWFKGPRGQGGWWRLMDGRLSLEQSGGHSIESYIYGYSEPARGSGDYFVYDVAVERGRVKSKYIWEND